MSAFKIICNKCSKESIIQQSNSNVEVKAMLVLNIERDVMIVIKYLFHVNVGIKQKMNS